MYLRKVQIKNIRSISDLDWSIPDDQEPGWHVVIGDNGAGKSTFLRSIALGLVGPKEALALRQNWNDWLSRGKPSGEIRLDISYDHKLDKFSAKNSEYPTCPPSSHLATKNRFVVTGALSEDAIHRYYS